MNKITILAGEVNDSLKKQKLVSMYQEALHKNIPVLALINNVPPNVEEDIKVIFVDEVNTIENMKNVLEAALGKLIAVDFVISTSLTRQQIISCAPEGSELMRQDTPRPERVEDIMQRMFSSKEPFEEFMDKILKASRPKQKPFVGLEDAISYLQKARSADNKHDFLMLLRNAAEGIANEASVAMGEEPTEENCGGCMAYNLLKELVDLKIMKDEYGKTPEYIKGKSAAWQNAIAFIRS